MVNVGNINVKTIPVRKIGPGAAGFARPPAEYEVENEFIYLDKERRPIDEHRRKSLLLDVSYYIIADTRVQENRVVSTQWHGKAPRNADVHDSKIFTSIVFNPSKEEGVYEEMIDYCTLKEAKFGHDLLVKKYGGPWTPPTKEEMNKIYDGL